MAKLADVYQDLLEQDLEKERATELRIQQERTQERRLTIENMLKVRFGSVDEQLATLVQPLAELSPEDYAQLLLQLATLSPEELLEHFGQ